MQWGKILHFILSKIIFKALLCQPASRLSPAETMWKSSIFSSPPPPTWIERMSIMNRPSYPPPLTFVRNFAKYLYTTAKDGARLPSPLWETHTEGARAYLTGSV